MIIRVLIMTGLTWWAIGCGVQGDEDCFTYEDGETICYYADAQNEEEY